MQSEDHVHEFMPTTVGAEKLPTTRDFVAVVTRVECSCGEWDEEILVADMADVGMCSDEPFRAMAYMTLDPNPVYEVFVGVRNHEIPSTSLRGTKIPAGRA